MKPPVADEWSRLVAERAAARAELVRAFDRIGERAKDPLRLKEMIRRHPVAAAGVAAGAGALLIRLLFPAGERAEDRAPAEKREAADAGPSLFDGLRDAAMRAAAPFVARFVEEHLGAVASASDNGRDDHGDAGAASAAGDGTNAAS